MQLPVRRALAAAFIIAFVVIAPLTVAYGRGYRFDLHTFRIRLTSVIALYGQSEVVTVTLDGQHAGQLRFPATLRSVLPGTHRIAISSPGKTSQAFDVQTFPGQTAFIEDIQLLPAQPWSVVRSGIPTNALLSPAGSAVAWLEKTSITIATPNAAVVLPALTGQHDIQWSPDPSRLLVRNVAGSVLATVTTSGTVTAGPEIPAAPDASTVAQLAAAANVAYTTFQHIPDNSGWLLVQTGNAYYLKTDGTLAIASRWFSPVIGTYLIGRNVLVTARNDALEVRNDTNGITASYPLAGIAQAGAGQTLGRVSVLTQDGDLLVWQQAKLF